MIRWVLGPILQAPITRTAAQVAAATPAAPATPAGPPKADPPVEVAQVDAAGWTVHLKLPTYDPATFNVLAEVRVYLVPNGADKPVDGPGYDASKLPFASTGDISTVQGGGDAAVPLPDVPAGDYFGQVVIGYAS